MKKKTLTIILVLLALILSGVFLFVTIKDKEKVSEDIILNENDNIYGSEPNDNNDPKNITRKPDLPSQGDQSGDFSATIAFARQEEDNVIVRAFGSTNKSGECELKLTSIKGVELTYTSISEPQPSYYQCSGFEIPISDLSNGKWKATVKYTDYEGLSALSSEVEFEVSL